MKIVFACLLALCVGLTGCKTTPTANQQLGITVLVDAAVGITLQRGSSDPLVWAKRAATVIDIATQLQALDEGQIATVPAIVNALKPLIAKANLAPAEQLAANSLVTALAQVIETNKNNLNMPTQAAIKLVLSNVITAAQVYIPTTG